MTKAKMKQFLRYKLNQLDKTMEPEKFYTRVEELFYRLRRIPVKQEQQERFDKGMDMMESHFYTHAKILEFNYKMRQCSANKKYQKPSLGPRMRKHSYEMLNIDIEFSLLPRKE